MAEVDRFEEIKYVTSDKKILIANYKKQYVNISQVVRSAISVAVRLIHHIKENNLEAAENYRWSIYDAIGIQNRSYILNEPFNLFDYFLNLLQYVPISDTIRMYKTKSQPENIWLDIGKNPFIPGASDTYGYKIHFICKPEYILYAFLKCIRLKDSPIGKLHTIRLKANFDSRAHLPIKGLNDSYFDDTINGGAAPSIIIYSGTDHSITKQLILSILEIFKDDIDKIGGMDRLDAAYSIPTFNIRLNKLVAYAAGDRSKKLDLRMANHGIQNYDENYPKGSFKKPKWIEDLQKSCSMANKDEINKKSLDWFGHTLCSDDGSPAPDPEPCGICYMIGNGKEPMLTPDEIFSDKAAAGSAAGGAGEKTGGGRKRRTRRRSKKTKKCTQH